MYIFIEYKKIWQNCTYNNSVSISLVSEDNKDQLADEHSLFGN